MEKLKYYSAHLIDWDKTVVDTEGIHFDSHSKAFEVFGLDIPDEQVEDTVDNLWPALRERVEHDRIQRIEDYIGKISNEQIVEAPLFPGAKEALEALYEQAQYGLAVVSNAYGDALHEAVHSNGLKDLFKVVISGSDVYFPKPVTEGVNKALQGLGDVDPVQALMFDDSYNGLKAARDAGVDQAYFSQGGGHKHFDDISPAFTISSWHEVIDALQ